MRTGEKRFGSSENLAPSSVPSLVTFEQRPIEYVHERDKALGEIRRLLGSRSLDEVQRVLDFVANETVATGDIKEKDA